MQAKDKEIRGTKFVIAGLKEGGFYRFRVRAINAAGIGEPGDVTEVIEIKDRIGIVRLQSLLLFSFLRRSLEYCI